MIKFNYSITHRKSHKRLSIGTKSGKTGNLESIVAVI